MSLAAAYNSTSALWALLPFPLGIIAGNLSAALPAHPMREWVASIQNGSADYLQLMPLATAAAIEMNSSSSNIIALWPSSSNPQDAFQRQLARTAGAQQQLRQMSEEQLQAIGARTEQIGEYVRPSPAIELGLIVFGLFGNVLTALTILLSDLIKSNANKYIFSMVFADSLYLACAFTDLLHIRSTRFWVCAFHEWLGNSAAYTSCACVVLLSVERFLAIVCPLEHMQMADLSRWLCILCTVAPFWFWHALVQWTSMVDTSNRLFDVEVHKCVMEPKMPFTGLHTLVSNCFHYLLPLVSATALNLIIAFKVRFSRDMKFLQGASKQRERHEVPIELGSRNLLRKRKAATPTVVECENGETTTTATNSCNSGATSSAQPKHKQNCVNGNAHHQQQQQQQHVPPMLFLIPLFYLLLNTPFFTVRYLTTSLLEINGIELQVPIAVHWAVYLIYIANYASNAIEYALASASFRKKIWHIWLRPLRKHLFRQRGSNITHTGTKTTSSTTLSTSSQPNLSKMSILPGGAPSAK